MGSFNSAVRGDGGLSGSMRYYRAQAYTASMEAAHETAGGQKTVKQYVLIGVVDPRYISEERKQALEQEGIMLMFGEDGFLRLLRERECGEEGKNTRKNYKQAWKYADALKQKLHKLRQMAICRKKIEDLAGTLSICEGYVSVIKLLIEMAKEENEDMPVLRQTNQTGKEQKDKAMPCDIGAVYYCGWDISRTLPPAKA